jgi:HEAT repeat protein
LALANVLPPRLRFLPPLIDLLDCEDPDTRSEAEDYLQDLGAESEEALLAALQKPSARIRSAAADRLERFEAIKGHRR